ncbi:MAG: (2Fe-2S)-binding protein, partial [Erysipelotrichaceae bacterium]|nr:(2Fe-2S)-binding protein [Erysipelotrichaceae bacterium]
ESIIMPKFTECKAKQEYVHRKPFIDMRKMSDEQINELISKDPDFGKIICRCEKISKGQIKDVINRKCGATTIRGVKMRCRPGMGRCQGGFCEPEVLKILSEELHQNVKEIKLDKKGSNVFVATAKEDL